MTNFSDKNIILIMTKGESVLLIVAIVIIVLVGLGLFINYTLSRIVKPDSAKNSRKTVGLFMAGFFTLFLGYLYYYLINYGC